jgi:hypothetical protein
VEPALARTYEEGPRSYLPAETALCPVTGETYCYECSFWPLEWHVALPSAWHKSLS